MPRTRKPKNIPKQNNDNDLSVTKIKTGAEILKEYNNGKAAILASFDTAGKTMLQKFDSDSKMLMISNKRIYKDMSLIDFVKMADDPDNLDTIKEALLSSKIATPCASQSSKLGGLSSIGSHTSISSVSTTCSSGYGSMKPPSSVPRQGYHSSQRRSRSAARNEQGPGSGMKRRSLSQPGSHKKTNHNTLRTPMITPKVDPHSTTKMFRVPVNGEMAFSSRGSPLLTTSATGVDAKPHLNLPLRDGRMMAILPYEGTIEERIFFSPDTKRRLVQLKENLEHLIN